MENGKAFQQNSVTEMFNTQKAARKKVFPCNVQI